MNTARTSQTAAQSPTSPPMVEALRSQIRKLETASRPDDAKYISTGCEPLNRLLPGNGLATGTITEWLSPTAGCGAELLSLLAAREACADGGALVVIDPEMRFYPTAARSWGINLENVIVLRNHKVAETTRRRSARSTLYWAIDQALRCPAVAAVWGCLGQVHERWLRRFQLSAEQSGAMGMFVRPLHLKGQPGWSEVQWEVVPRVAGNGSAGDGRAVLEKGSVTTRKQGQDGSAQPRMTAPMQHALQASLAPTAPFDRLLQMRLLRVRGGQRSEPSRANSLIRLRVDFTTGSIKQDQLQHESAIRQHSVRASSQLAHPATGGRQQRA